MPTPEYVLELRAMIGHHPLWLPGVTALVTDEHGRVLLGQRSDSGLWALPSGISEPGEEMAATCAREVLEETGIVIEVTELISIQAVGPVVYDNQDVTSYADHFFRCRPISGTARIADDESIAVGWFDPAQLPRPYVDQTPRLLAVAAEQEGTGRTRFSS